MIIPPENNSNTPLSVTFSSWSFDYLKMNFLGLLTPPDTAFLLFLLHSWTAWNSCPVSTLSPFTPSQALGCMCIPTNTALIPPGTPLPTLVPGLSQPCPVPWARPCDFCRTALPCLSLYSGVALNLLPGLFPLTLISWCLKEMLMLSVCLICFPLFSFREILLPLPKMFLRGTMNHGTSEMGCDARKGQSQAFPGMFWIGTGDWCSSLVAKFWNMIPELPGAMVLVSQK